MNQNLGNRQHLPAGIVLDGSYRIERVIGSGGFGITYMAEDFRLKTTVAVKEYFPDQFGIRAPDQSVAPISQGQVKTFEWGRDSFLREAETLARFRHPSIVQVTRVFEANATAYMVMAFEQGMSLEDWLRGLQRPPTQEELDRIAGPILDALELMHTQSFLHRDIAPDNIIIRKDDTPVLLDFGAARRAVAEQSRMLTGLVKQGYSPHEQYSADGRHQGPWTDVYAFGATLYRAVTGSPPDEATLRIVEDHMTPATQAAHVAYRPGFLDAIDTCLRVKPSERPQTVGQLRGLLLAPSRPLPSPPKADAPVVVSRVVRVLPPAKSAPESVRGPIQQSPSARAPSQPTDGTIYVGSWKSRSSPQMVFIGVAVLALAASTLAAGVFLFRASQTADPVSAPALPTPPSKSIERKFDPEIASPRPVEKAPRSDPVAALSPGSGASARDNLANGSPCPYCPEMVVVPSGRFKMGSPGNEPQRSDDEQQVPVTIPRPFAVGKFAVTFDEWDACVADGGCNGYRPADESWGRGRRPVINVNWDDAKAYAGWLSRKTGKTYRLPSESEREYFTRAGTITPFWWGSSITPAQANYDGRYAYDGGGSKGEYRKQTLPVDGFAANPWGLYQVHGNVWEWVEDCWTDRNTGNPGNGGARTTGCTDDGRRVVRGGSWDYGPRGLRSAYRGGNSSDFRYFDLGFRVARTLNP